MAQIFKSYDKENNKWVAINVVGESGSSETGVTIAQVEQEVTDGITSDTYSQLSTPNKTVVGGINDAYSQANSAVNQANTATSTATTANDTANANLEKIGTLSSLNTTNKNNLVNATNEVNQKANINKSNIGTTTSLTTNAKDTLVDSINEVNAKTNLNKNHIGTMTNLATSAKDTLVDAINETFQSVSNGKTLVANAITDKGVATSSTDTFATMANNISQIETGSGTITFNYDDFIKFYNDKGFNDRNNFNGYPIDNLNPPSYNYANSYFNKLENLNLNNNNNNNNYNNLFSNLFITSDNIDKLNSYIENNINIDPNSSNTPNISNISGLFKNSILFDYFSKLNIQLKIKFGSNYNKILSNCILYNTNFVINFYDYNDGNRRPYVESLIEDNTNNFTMHNSKIGFYRYKKNESIINLGEWDGSYYNGIIGISEQNTGSNFYNFYDDCVYDYSNVYNNVIYLYTWLNNAPYNIDPLKAPENIIGTLNFNLPYNFSDGFTYSVFNTSYNYTKKNIVRVNKIIINGLTQDSSCINKNFNISFEYCSFNESLYISAKSIKNRYKSATVKFTNSNISDAVKEIINNNFVNNGYTVVYT